MDIVVKTGFSDFLENIKMVKTGFNELLEKFKEFTKPRVLTD